MSEKQNGSFLFKYINKICCFLLLSEVTVVVVVVVMFALIFAGSL